MYKARFSTWGLAKNYRKRDMVHVLRIKAERDAQGLPSEFRIHGEVVPSEVIARYVRRKGTRELPYEETPPSYITYRTPSPVVRSPKSVVKAPVSPSHWEHVNAGFIRPVGGGDSSGSESSQSPLYINEKGRMQWCFVPGHPSSSSSISRSPSPPRHLLVSERLFTSINTYFDGSFHNGTFVIDDNGRCTSLPAIGNPALFADFWTYSSLSASFVKKKSPIEFRRTLSRAFGLVQMLLTLQHPRTLEAFFKTFLFLIQNGLGDVVLSLRKYIGEMAKRVVAHTYPQWARVLQLIASLDEDMLEEAILQSFRCTIESFEAGLDLRNTDRLGARLNYIKAVTGPANPAKEELMLREMIASGIDSPMVAIRLGENLNAQGRYIHAESVAMELLARISSDPSYAPRKADQIMPLEMLAHSQYHQNRRVEAEMNIRDAMNRAVYEWGITDAWALNMRNVLEGWLRDWGNNKEADVTSEEMVALIGKDQTDYGEMLEGEEEERSEDD